MGLTDHDDLPDVGPEQLDTVLAFLPLFTQPGFVFGQWHAPEGRMPYYELSPEVLEFLRTLGRQGLIFVFDWPAWTDEARVYVTDPDALARADLLTLRKLLTLHIRLDRFVEGHLAGVLEDGHIAAILRRLKAIREEMTTLGDEGALS